MFLYSTVRGSGNFYADCSWYYTQTIRASCLGPRSPYHLPHLRAIMVSFAEFELAKTLREKALAEGLHGALGVPEDVQLYLDNGAFSNIRADKKLSTQVYWKFAKQTNPDWYTIPADFIPLPSMSEAEQQDCFKKTMFYNYRYSFDGCVPVVHAGAKLEQYLKAFAAHDVLVSDHGVNSFKINGLIS